MIWIGESNYVILFSVFILLFFGFSMILGEKLFMLRWCCDVRYTSEMFLFYMYIFFIMIITNVILFMYLLFWESEICFLKREPITLRKFGRMRNYKLKEGNCLIRFNDKGQFKDGICLTGLYNKCLLRGLSYQQSAYISWYEHIHMYSHSHTYLSTCIHI